jgi:hypothetical protein
VRKLILIGFTQVLLLIAGCGGGGSGAVLTSPGTSNNGTGGGQTIAGAAANVVTMTVDSGPDPANAIDVDTPFITVTICQPGTTNCATIDHVEVDTQSYGLRIMYSALTAANSALYPALAFEQTPSSQTLVECTQFADGFSWGPITTADVKISGESASAVPMQVIGDPNYENSTAGAGQPPTEIPTACSSVGTEEDSVATFGANGIIGVGPFVADCGSGCAPGSSNNPGWYYSCPANGTSTTVCTGTTATVNQQVANPVAFFQTDNNGVIVELPSVPDPDGTPSVTGALVFGIGTEGNNGLGGATVLTADPSNGNISSTFNGQTLSSSYFDSGSNAYFFHDGSITSGKTCSDAPSGTSYTWFCPGAEMTLSVTNSSYGGGVTSSVSVKLADAFMLFNNFQSNTAFDDIGAESGNQTPICGSSNCAFDFGLPFFFGRNVFVAIAKKNTSGGMGPYYGY